METEQVIKERRSIRKYTQQAVDPEIIKDLIDQGTLAPSAMNSQPWAFFMIQEKQLLVELNQKTKGYLLAQMDERPAMKRYQERFESENFDIFYGSSSLLVICGRTDQPSMEGDCHLAGQNIMLAAWEKNIGSCCLGFAKQYLNTSEAREWLSIPAGYQVVLPIILGYFEDRPATPERKKTEILFWK